MSMDMALLSCAPVPCPLTWHSARVAASAATPILCRKNAAAPRVARQWVRRVVVPCPLTWHSARVAASAATPILCRKKNAAAPQVARQWVRPRSSAMSIDVALSTRRGVGRDTYSLPQKNAAAPRDHVNGHGPTKLRPRCHVYRFRFCNVDTFSLRRGYNAV